jgi:septum formation protein
MLILASASPRRSELLQQAGVRFEVRAAHIDETRREDEDPAAYVRRLAVEKAEAVRALQPAATVLGADTTVVLTHRGSTGGQREFAQEILSKPTDLAEAERMLRALSGRVHHVLTGVAVVSPEAAVAHVETTAVFFGAIEEADLARYLATGDSMDKAGAYGIQGYAARWITRVEGDFFNVVGLPIAATVRLLREAGCRD